MKEFKITIEDLYLNGEIRPFEDIYIDAFGAAFRRQFPEFTDRVWTDEYFVHNDLKYNIIAAISKPFNMQAYIDLKEGITFETTIEII